jgi:hypothetical protein
MPTFPASHPRRQGGLSREPSKEAVAIQGGMLGAGSAGVSVKAVAYFEHNMSWQYRCSLHTCSPTQRSTWVSPSPFTSGQVARAPWSATFHTSPRALLLVLTKLLDRIVTRWYLCA